MTASSDRADTQLEELRRLVQAKKLLVARKLRAGEDVSASELDKLARLEIRVSTHEQFLRLRELTRQPDLATPMEAAVARRATTTKRKGTRATRTKTEAD